MKNFNLYKLVMLLMVTVAIVSCVQDDDFETPNTIVVAPNLEGDVLTIMGINSAFEQLVADAADDLGVDPSDFNYEDVLAELRETEKLTFDTEVITYVEGYVISNDQSGNFFEELVLQDKAENPTAGIVVQIDVNPLFTIYDFGRKGLSANLSKINFELKSIEIFLAREVLPAPIFPSIAIYLNLEISN